MYCHGLTVGAVTSGWLGGFCRWCCCRWPGRVCRGSHWGHGLIWWLVWCGMQSYWVWDPVLQARHHARALALLLLHLWCQLYWLLCWLYMLLWCFLAAAHFIFVPAIAAVVAGCKQVQLSALGTLLNPARPSLLQLGQPPSVCSCCWTPKHAPAVAC